MKEASMSDPISTRTEVLPGRRPAAGAGRTHQLSRTQLVSRPIPEVFAFFSDASNLEALTPPFLHFHILTQQPIELRSGAQLDYQLSLFGVPLRWRTRITDWQPGRRFVDEQESGPYALWRHTHEFEARGTSTLVRDVVDYLEPLGPVGTLAHLLFVRRTLDRIFDFRRDANARLLDRSGSSQPAEDRETSDAHVA
jgi:ligand-binding SRPBCC domain-containing protein